jgi:hypothetical protein
VTWFLDVGDYRFAYCPFSNVNLSSFRTHHLDDDSIRPWSTGPFSIMQRPDRGSNKNGGSPALHSFIDNHYSGSLTLTDQPPIPLTVVSDHDESRGPDGNV